MEKQEHKQSNSVTNSSTLETFKSYLDELEKTDKSPYRQALKGLKVLENSAANQEEKLLHLTLDIINTALSTTIMEELLSTLKLHHDVALPLIEKYCDSTKEREQLINIHTNNHVNFIRHGGKCEGCASCEGHEDIIPLLGPWTRKDTDFFQRLYVEVQAIYCALERLLYEFIPEHTDFLNGLDVDTLNSIREHVASSVRKKIHTM